MVIADEESEMNNSNDKRGEPAYYLEDKKVSPWYRFN